MWQGQAKKQSEMCEKIFIISQVLPDDDALKIMKWNLPKKNDVISLQLWQSAVVAEKN